MTITHIKVLARDVQLAEDELERALTEAWPVGASILVKLSSRQKKGTIAEVEGHSCRSGHVQVRLSTENRRGNRTVKRIWYPNIITPPIG